MASSINTQNPNEIVHIDGRWTTVGQLARERRQNEQLLNRHNWGGTSTRMEEARRHGGNDGGPSTPRRSKGQPAANQPSTPQSTDWWDGLDQDLDEDARVHGHIAERPRNGHLTSPTATFGKPVMRLNANIREYIRHPIVKSASPSWLSTSEIPSAEEIVGAEGEIAVPQNKIRGPWSNKEEYFRSLYELLREDAVAPLRSAVEEVRATPLMTEYESEEHAAIYENVFITGMTFAPKGIAVRVSFSLRRAGKKIRWEQSKRLLAGTIVALTPANDMFTTICKVAVVAARPLARLALNPPQVDLFFAAVDEIEIDPHEEWLMVESRSGYYEAHRHTLLALQKMRTESFPLSEHLVDIQQDISAPAYVESQPYKDLSLVLNSLSDPFRKVNVLTNWPDNFTAELDLSQVDALRQILTKRLAIVQGPPGTGKTHVSVVALRVLLANMTAGDPPIIVTAQTNHALDQLLRHVGRYEPEFIRLGGRTSDMENIGPRTLHAIRQAVALPKLVGGIGNQARKRYRDLSNDLSVILGPLTDINCKTPLTSEVFLHFGLITQVQYDSLQEGADAWVGAAQDSGPIAVWLGSDLIPAEKRRCPQDFGLEFEEIELEYEKLKELEAELNPNGDEYETLKGEYVQLVEPFTGRSAAGVTEEAAFSFLKKDDMWDIPNAVRGAVYKYLARKFKEQLTVSFRRNASSYKKISEDLQIGKFEIDSVHLSKARIIGMTTTGLSKYRALVSSLKPKIVLIEEAAETVEPHVAVACFESLEHLILVGDHQQLRGHCAVSELEGDPFNLAVSLFERMVKNKVEFTQLKTQRRMLPEIRRILTPIYKNLEDHASVFNRADIAGMGGINSYFYTHRMMESNDEFMSKRNVGEATMVAGFFDYLVQNDNLPQDITILTFYNGQRKTIMNLLKQRRSLPSVRFNVVTVDSYQGEENEIILLSLVRSHSGESGIGFLNIANRVCVALSRARRGFYIFGNDRLLRAANPLWKSVCQILEGSPIRLGPALPITCRPHGRRLDVGDPLEWDLCFGGCQEPCYGILPCGHSCPLKCHPFEHEQVRCTSSCDRKFSCGHSCTEPCGVRPCKCSCGNYLGSDAWKHPKVGANKPAFLSKKQNTPSRPVPTPKSTHVTASPSSSKKTLTPIRSTQKTVLPNSREVTKLPAAPPKLRPAPMTDGKSVLPNDVLTAVPNKLAIIAQPNRTEKFDDDDVVGKTGADLLKEADKATELALFGGTEDTSRSGSGSESSEVMTRTGEVRLRKKFIHTYPVWDLSAGKKKEAEKEKEEMEEVSLLD